MRHYGRHQKDRFIEQCFIPTYWIDDLAVGEENFKGTKCLYMHTNNWSQACGNCFERRF